jgi:hypothetical protein
MFGRLAEPLWKRKLAAPYAHLVFGARQTGKSTLLRKVLPETAIWLDFSRPAERAEYLRNPDLLVQRCTSSGMRVTRCGIRDTRRESRITHPASHIPDLVSRDAVTTERTQP